jgi:hypothetical protein
MADLVAFGADADRLGNGHARVGRDRDVAGEVEDALVGGCGSREDAAGECEQ